MVYEWSGRALTLDVRAVVAGCFGRRKQSTDAVLGSFTGDEARKQMAATAAGGSSAESIVTGGARRR